MSVIQKTIFNRDIGNELLLNKSIIGKSDQKDPIFSTFKDNCIVFRDLCGGTLPAIAIASLLVIYGIKEVANKVKKAAEPAIDMLMTINEWTEEVGGNIYDMVSHKATFIISLLPNAENISHGITAINDVDQVMKVAETCYAIAILPVSLNRCSTTLFSLSVYGLYHNIYKRTLCKCSSTSSRSPQQSYNEKWNFIKSIRLWSFGSNRHNEIGGDAIPFVIGTVGSWLSGVGTFLSIGFTLKSIIANIDNIRILTVVNETLSDKKLPQKKCN